MATRLINVKPSKRHETVRVRVIHCWWQNQHGKDPSLELIIADEQAGRMPATLRGKKAISQWQHVLNDGATVSITGYSAASNGSQKFHKFQPTSHPYKILFNQNTVVSPILDYTGSRYGFNFTTFTQIHTNTAIKDLDCVDVIGALVRIENITSFKKQDNTEENKMTCFLKDLESVEVRLTLFGKYIEVLQDELNKQEPNKPIVIIVQFAKINKWMRGKGVANAFSGTKLFVNSDIPEVNDFLQRYDGVGPVERIQAANSLSVQTNPSDFFKDCSYVPLNDYMLHEPDGNYVTFATIDSIEPDEAWWYSACKPCNKKVKSDEKGLWCPDCGENPKSLTAKFKVYVREKLQETVKDNSTFHSKFKDSVNKWSSTLDDVSSDADTLDKIVENADKVFAELDEKVAALQKVLDHSKY